MSSSDSPLNATHKSNCPLDISTWISNKNLKFTMSRTELLIFSPKPVHPMVFPISVNANSLHNFLRPKAWHYPQFLSFILDIWFINKPCRLDLIFALNLSTFATFAAILVQATILFHLVDFTLHGLFLPLHSCLLSLLQPLCCSWNRPDPCTSALEPVHWRFPSAKKALPLNITFFRYLLKSHLAPI